MTNPYPTISISLTDERMARVNKILRALRSEDETISRSEAVGRAIDHLFLAMCLSEKPDGVEAADIAA